MPKIFIHCPVGTFTPDAKTEMISEITNVALKLENIPDTVDTRSIVWAYINEYQKDNVVNGNKSAVSVISIEVNAIKGKLNASTKEMLIEQFTETVLKYADIPNANIKPVYVVIREIDGEDWGIFGKSIAIS